MWKINKDFKSIIPVSISVAAAYTVCQWGLYAQPQLFIPLMQQYNVSDPEVGKLFMVENLTYFFALLLAIVPTTRYSRTKIALLGSVILILGNVASAYAGSIDELMVYRVIAAFGGAFVSGSATTSASASRDPDRTFAVAAVMSGLVFVIGFAAIPYVLETYNARGVYLMMVIVGLVALPFYNNMLPPIKMEEAKSNFIKLLMDAPYRVIAVLAMAGLFIYELGQNAVFTYMDKLGADTGVPAEDRGMYIALGSLFGLMGSSLVAWLGTRFGRFWPLVIGLSINIGISILFALIENPDYYFYMLFIWDISYMFILPYLMGTLASLDKQGRWALTGNAFWDLAAGPGPYIATLIVAYGGYNHLAMWVFTSGALGMALFCYTAKKSDKVGLEEA